jgi:hypothetical protein
MTPKTKGKVRTFKGFSATLDVLCWDDNDINCLTTGHPAEFGSSCTCPTDFITDKPYDATKYRITVTVVSERIEKRRTK